MDNSFVTSIKANQKVNTHLINFHSRAENTA